MIPNRQSTLRRALVLMGAAVMMMMIPPSGMSGPASGARLSFDVSEGLNLNSFLRDGPVAAHLVLRAGSDPRILVAFPAGNSGVGLWFSHGLQPATWTLLAPPQPLIVTGREGTFPVRHRRRGRHRRRRGLKCKAGGSVQCPRAAGLPGSGHFSGGSRDPAHRSELDDHLGARSAGRRGRISPQHRGH